MNKYIRLLALPAAAAAVILAASFSVSASDETEAQQPFAVTDTSASETDNTVTETTISETEFVQTETGTQEAAVSETQPVITDAPEAVTQKVTAVTPPKPDSSVVNGWNNINGKWYYFDGEKFLTGISEIDGEYYLFAYSGSLKTGWQTIKNKRCYFDSETHSPVYGWIDFNGNRYFCDKSRGKVTGMQKIGDNIYIFSSQGIMQTGKIRFIVKALPELLCSLRSVIRGFIFREHDPRQIQRGLPFIFGQSSYRKRARSGSNKYNSGPVMSASNHKYGCHKTGKCQNRHPLYKLLFHCHILHTLYSWRYSFSWFSFSL